VQKLTELGSAALLRGSDPQQFAAPVHLTDSSALLSPEPMPPGFGALTFDQCAPFQRSTWLISALPDPPPERPPTCLAMPWPRQPAP